jgi:NADH:ubiquinone oxidoreductase subunit K
VSFGLDVVLVASVALFAIGAFGLVARRSTIVMLLGAQLMLVAGAIAFVAFGRFGLGAQQDNTGPTMALFVGAASVAELAVGLVLALLLYRDHHGLSPDVDTP